jgi:transposase InsO family protein
VASENFSFTEGHPECLHCDNGTKFLGEVKQLCIDFGIKMIHGTAYHPQSQGRVERVNQTLKAKIVKTFCSSSE